MIPLDVAYLAGDNQDQIRRELSQQGIPDHLATFAPVVKLLRRLPPGFVIISIIVIGTLSILWLLGKLIYASRTALIRYGVIDEVAVETTTSPRRVRAEKNEFTCQSSKFDTHGNFIKPWKAPEARLASNGNGTGDLSGWMNLAIVVSIMYGVTSVISSIYQSQRPFAQVWELIKVWISEQDNTITNMFSWVPDLLKTFSIMFLYFFAFTFTYQKLVTAGYMRPRVAHMVGVIGELCLFFIPIVYARSKYAVDWPFTQRMAFMMEGCVLSMKAHSYIVVNRHLATEVALGGPGTGDSVFAAVHSRHHPSADAFSTHQHSQATVSENAKTHPSKLNVIIKKIGNQSHGESSLENESTTTSTARSSTRRTLRPSNDARSSKWKRERGTSSRKNSMNLYISSSSELSDDEGHRSDSSSRHSSRQDAPKRRRIRHTGPVNASAAASGSSSDSGIESNGVDAPENLRDSLDLDNSVFQLLKHLSLSNMMRTCAQAMTSRPWISQSGRDEDSDYFGRKKCPVHSTRRRAPLALEGVGSVPAYPSTKRSGDGSSQLTAEDQGTGNLNEICTCNYFPHPSGMEGAQLVDSGEVSPNTTALERVEEAASCGRCSGASIPFPPQMSLTDPSSGLRTAESSFSGFSPGLFTRSGGSKEEMVESESDSDLASRSGDHGGSDEESEEREGREKPKGKRTSRRAAKNEKKSPARSHEKISREEHIPLSGRSKNTDSATSARSHRTRPRRRSGSFSEVNAPDMQGTQHEEKGSPQSKYLGYLVDNSARPRFFVGLERLWMYLWSTAASIGLVGSKYTTNEEKRSTTLKTVAYPHNITLKNFLNYSITPTLCYDPNYPRTDSIDIAYLLEKLMILTCLMVANLLIYSNYVVPIVKVVNQTPILVSTIRLLLPITGITILTFFIVFECILNFSAEVAKFGDRGFYDDWYNSTTFAEFSRKWNKPVHEWLLRHIYLDTIRRRGLSAQTGLVTTYLVSIVGHELILFGGMGLVTPYLAMLSICQLPLMSLLRHPIFRGKRLGNILFWTGLIFGLSLCTALYASEYIPKKEMLKAREGK